MNGRVLWFLLGAASASIFWIVFIQLSGRGWLEEILKIV